MMNETVTRLGPWRIERTITRDLAGIYYAGRADGGEGALLYLLSGELAAARGEALTRLLALHARLSHPGLVRFRSVDHDGGETYLVADAVEDALAPLRAGGRPGSGQARALGAALAAALVAAHDLGLVHGGLDLDNVLWAAGRGPLILGAGVAALGITGHGNLAQGDLAQGDVAALGRLLCTLVADRQRLGAHGRRIGGHDPDGPTVEIVRLLADPSAAISMREAHARLAEGEATRAACGASGIAGATDTSATAPRGPGDRGGRVAVGSGAAPTHASGSRGLDAGAPAGPTSPTPDPRRGYLGRYRILTRLGRGGMGEVLLADDPALRRGVAIKRIRPELARDRTFRARLRREAQLAARLNHRAIVQIFDLVTDDRTEHVVMEYVPGPSLSTLLGDRPMAASEAVRIAAEVADALDHAHRQGVIHRDLKRENVLIGTDGQPKITDFGIACRTATTRDTTAGDSLTPDGSMIGTPRAMSPEQILGQDIDPRSDLFSFGVLLYELVTGASPFASGSDVQTILCVLHHHPPPAHELAPEVPRALSALIDQLLEKHPARRPDGARTVRDRLHGLGDSPEPARPIVPARLRPATAPGATSAAGERRQVTLMCMELIAAGGGESADPELLVDVLPAFRARLDEILARFDGILISALGHRFVACFGHPRPLEDAARRAVLAGRAMLAAAADLRAADPVHAGACFAAAGAIHTGLAVARGRDDTGEELMLGATLNAALELLQLGRAGDLWLSDAAARLVEAEFELERPATLPGGATSPRRFVASRVARGISAGAHDRPMVGRDHEMQLLLGSWRRARAGQGQVALLVGEAGIGKSRLTRELARAIAGDHPRQIILRGGAVRQRSALEPVAEAVPALLPPGGDAGRDGGTGDSAAIAARIRSLTGPDEAEQVLHFLGRVDDPPAGPPERARHQLLCGLRDLLVGTSREVPTLIVVEDLHWLDPSTLDLVALIIQDVAAWPLFLVMTTRPSVQAPWPVAAVTQLRLGRLEAPEIDAVIAHACSGRALPAGHRALIAACSEGVPLYAEELVRAALELGRTGEVPSTLRDALTARLHQLGPAATWVAQVAAACGREFAADLLVAAGGLGRAEVDHELDRLVAAEILVRRPGRGREALYQFGHVLLQQAAYEELLAADRRHLHGQLADALLADARDGRDPSPELVAHHLASARRLDEAIAWAHRAALRALDRQARVEARELLRQALGWLDQLPESGARDRTELGLRMQLGAVLIATEGYTSPELERSCRRTEILCQRHDDMPLPARFGLWAVRFMGGSPDEIEPCVGWFEQVIGRDAPPVERMMAHVSLAMYAYAGARYDRASDHFAHGRALFAPAEHARVVQSYGGCGGFYGHIFTTLLLWRTGRFGEAWRHVRSTVVLAETLDPYALAAAVSTEMMLHLAVGDVARTEASADRIHELAARYEFPYVACWARCGRGWALARRGQAERGMAELAAGTEGIQRIGVKVHLPYCLGLFAESAIALGQWSTAERALDEALAVCRTSVDRTQEPELLRLRGQLILGRDATAHAPARAAFADALAVAQHQGALASALRAATDLAALLRDARSPDEARAVLDPVYRGFAPCPDDPDLATARQLLAALSPGVA